jgi:hypothetical protein
MCRALWGRAVLSLIAGALVFAVASCGGGSENSTVAKSAFNADQEQGTTTCGHPGATVELHGVNSRRSTLTLSDDRGKMSWVCTKPSRSLYATLRCRHGARYFTIEFAPQ